MTSEDAGRIEPGSTDATGTSDADLVLRSRSGDRAAFSELWRRHYRSGIVVARSVSPDADPDDLVQEAYTKIYQSIVLGGGPTGSFRAYLFTVVRNTATAWGRARRETTLDDADTVEDPATTDAAAAEALDRGLTHRAFRSLPSRWQEILWYTEIEQMKPAEIAPLLGMKPTAVARLAFRAREGLREAWIQAHLRSLEDGSECAWTIEHLGAHTRNGLGTRSSDRIETHIAECARCAVVAAEARDVGSRLALVLLPLTVGVAGSSAYLAAIQTGSVSTVALAAMPAAITDGGLVASGSAAGLGASGAGAQGLGAQGLGAASVGGGAAATSTSGAFAGMGLAATLVVGGVVATGAVFAAAVVPAVIQAASDTGSGIGGGSLQDASAAIDASVLTPWSWMSPSDLPAEDSISVPVPAPTPSAPSEPRTDDPVPPDEETTPDRPILAPTPTAPQPQSPTDETPSAAPQPSPTQPTEPERPNEPAPGPPTPAPSPDPVDPGPVDPVDPGPVDPGPDPVDPGPVDPDPVDPGPVDPGETGDPGGSDEPTEPATPALTAPTISSTRASLSSTDFAALTYDVTVAGTPGATADVVIGGSTRVSGPLDDDGVATLSFQASLAEVLFLPGAEIKLTMGEQQSPGSYLDLFGIAVRDILGFPANATEDQPTPADAPAP